MTIEETIRIIKFHCEPPTRDFHPPFFLQAMPIAIAALEKQIPKKPKNQYEENELLQGSCPNCDANVNVNESRRVREFCGQALVWREGEERW